MGIGVKGRGVGKRELGVCMWGGGGGGCTRRGGGGGGGGQGDCEIKKECKPTNLI